jgi:hypothetical protein
LATFEKPQNFKSPTNGEIETQLLKDFGQGKRWIDYGGGSHNLAFSISNNRITTTGSAMIRMGT